MTTRQQIYLLRDADIARIEHAAATTGKSKSQVIRDLAEQLPVPPDDWLAARDRVTARAAR